MRKEPERFHRIDKRFRRHLAEGLNHRPYAPRLAYMDNILESVALVRINFQALTQSRMRLIIFAQSIEHTRSLV